MGEFRSERLQQSRRRKRRRLKPVIKQFFVLFLIGALTVPTYKIVTHFMDENSKKSKPAKTGLQVSKKEPQPEKTPEKQPEKVVATKMEDVNNSPAIDDYLKSLNFNGTALVVKNDKVMIDKGYGSADMEKKVPNNAETVFYIGSISKVFVSTAIMQLQEQGKLNVNDLLSKYIPDFPNGNKITLYHLLTHTSGIPEHQETNVKISHDDLIKKIGQGQLKFQPGTDWLYSDSNYAILAYILEKQTGESLESYVTEHVFKKAGLTHTGFGDAYYQEPYPSKGYKLKDGAMVSPSLPDMSQLFGCGDIYTTPYDMYLFDKSLYSGKLISENSLKQFFTPFKHNYAFGLYNDPGSYSDHGVLPGWNCLNSFSKNGTIYVVLLSNVQNGVKSLGVVNNQIYMLLKGIN
ncbi:serine hydrolase domain-containing protein [Neobacillus massiliamazoniensis]|jgi:CubicO group peptidase (beta-lactamase class C family)|uniref:Beta-lactamase n=1 Tax=Neobacillus massiliamazoniensis TaxID=1499688 RepID=A0A0U1NYL6_9BACI|nr:serine hydrolase domain-containing protein [Neobacillus massiliamazoniensis]CRK83073.1 beta-lactamase [Neobacillus massiliamazoniensis]